MRSIICIPDTALYIHIKHQAPHAYTCKHACIEQTTHFHSERGQSFSASECEVSVRACASVFETSVQAHLKVQICSRSCSQCNFALAAYALSALAAKWGVLEASTSLEPSLQSLSKLRPIGSKLRYTHSLSLFSPKDVDGPS